MGAVGGASAIGKLETLHEKGTADFNGHRFVMELYAKAPACDGKSLYSVSDGVNAISFPIRWTIGKRMQTWVLERNGHYLESLAGC